MTGFPDDPLDGPHGDHHRDPLERLLRPPGEFLPTPPGAFERIRRRAARRRRTRAMAGGAVVAAMITGSVYLVGFLSPDGSDRVVGPPASSAQNSHTPAETTPPARPTTPATPPATRGASGSSSEPTPSPRADATTSPTRSTAPATTPTPATPATPQCTADQLTAALGGGDAAAGNLYSYLVITNHSNAACHVNGFPGLSMLDAGGRQIGAPATREQIAHQPVILAPGEAASDTIHTIDQQGTCLPTSASLRIYPPGSRASLVIPGQLTNCDNLFVITPFAAGRTGNPAG